MLLGVALFCGSVAPARAGVHVLQFTVPAGFANYLFHLDDPNLNGKPTAKLVVTQGYFSAANDHPIGVYFDDSISPKGMWSVFNEDFANLPPGATFNVLVGPLATVNASTTNSIENLTFFTKASGKPPFYKPAPGKKFGVPLLLTHVAAAPGHSRRSLCHAPSIPGIRQHRQSHVAGREVVHHQ